MKNFLLNLGAVGGFLGFIAILPAIIEKIEFSTKNFIYTLLILLSIAIIYCIGKNCKKFFKYFIKRG